jgi:hypothetical protein
MMSNRTSPQSASSAVSPLPVATAGDASSPLTPATPGNASGGGWKRHRLSHDLALRIIPFLPVDALRCFGLASRGCRKAAQSEEQRRSPIDIPLLHKISDLPLCAQQLYCDFVRLMRESIQTSRSPRQPVTVPGMTWEESCDVDRAIVRWPSTHTYYPFHASSQPSDRHRPVEMRIVWQLTETLHSDGGKHGVSTGVAASESAVLLAYSAFAHSGGGVTSLDLRLVVCRVREMVIDARWSLNVGREALPMADDTAVISQDSFVSSRPFVFPQLYEYDAAVAAQSPGIAEELRNVKLEDPARSIVAPQTALESFCSAKYIGTGSSRDGNGPMTTLRQYIRFITAHRVAFSPLSHKSDEVFRRVSDHLVSEFLDPVSRDIETLQQRLYRRRDLNSVLTTPKGLWSVATGFAEMTEVDYRTLWKERSSALVASLRRNWDRGLSELWLSGMLPIAFVATADTRSSVRSARANV